MPIDLNAKRPWVCFCLQKPPLTAVFCHVMPTFLPCAVKEHFHRKVQFLRVGRPMNKCGVILPPIFRQRHARPHAHGGEFLPPQGKHVFRCIGFCQRNRLLSGKLDRCRVRFPIKENTGLLCIPYDSITAGNSRRKVCRHGTQCIFHWNLLAKECILRRIMRQQCQPLSKDIPGTSQFFTQSLLHQPPESAGCRSFFFIPQQNFALLGLGHCHRFFSGCLQQIAKGRQARMLLRPRLQPFTQTFPPLRCMLLQKLNFLCQCRQYFLFSWHVNRTQPLLSILSRKRLSLPCIRPAHLHCLFQCCIMYAKAMKEHVILFQMQLFFLHG